ncbi:MAG: AMP-binding protein, partial [Thermodesulfobacteriota bacterium]
MVDEKTVPELIANKIKKYNSKLLFQRRDGWSWKQITWLDFERDVKSVASFLIDLGFRPGDASLVVSSNRIESISTEIAVWSIGGVTIPIAESEPLENIARIANQFKVKFIFAGKESTLDEIQEIYRELRCFERIVCFADVNGTVKIDKII